MLEVEGILRQDLQRNRRSKLAFDPDNLLLHSECSKDTVLLILQANYPSMNEEIDEVSLAFDFLSCGDLLSNNNYTLPDYDWSVAVRGALFAWTDAISLEKKNFKSILKSRHWETLKLQETSRGNILNAASQVGISMNSSFNDLLLDILPYSSLLQRHPEIYNGLHLDTDKKLEWNGLTLEDDEIED